MHPQVHDQQPELTALCRQYGVRRLEIFGSGAKAQTSDAARDFDFLVEFENLPPEGYADAYFGLLEDLERLFQRRVDLVMTSAVSNPYFLEDIAASRTVLYGA